MLTTLRFHAALLSIAQLSAAITLLVNPEPSAPIAFRSTMCAPGAMSRMMPATCVPWPFSSRPSERWTLAPVKSRLSATRLARYGCFASTPVSITATPMPRPVNPRNPSKACRHLIGANRLGRHASPSA